jgi:uncharacterized protein YndB with AHSA1/START domain
MDVKVERSIPGAISEVFDAWLDASVPGAFGYDSEKLIVDMKVDGLWYWLTREGTPHFGRFLEVERPARLRQSWMSPYTLGQESIVTVTFEPRDTGTLMTLVHAGLPNDQMVAAHERGWAQILDALGAGFGARAGQRAAG